MYIITVEVTEAAVHIIWYTYGVRVLIWLQERIWCKLLHVFIWCELSSFDVNCLHLRWCVSFDVMSSFDVMTSSFDVNCHTSSRFRCVDVASNVWETPRRKAVLFNFFSQCRLKLTVLLSFTLCKTSCLCVCVCVSVLSGCSWVFDSPPTRVTRYYNMCVVCVCVLLCVCLCNHVCSDAGPVLW